MFLAKGVPDTLYHIGGVMFLLESKVAPNKVKKGSIQEEQIKRINSSGGSAWEVRLEKDELISLGDMNDTRYFDSIEKVFNYITQHVRSKICQNTAL
jgi:hypothetical protein